jgi:anti-sigma factor RsiW
MTEKKECRELDGALAPYVDGEADASSRAAVESHLSRCPPCRDAEAGERSARDVLHARREQLRPRAPDFLRARCAAHGRAAAPRRSLLRRAAPFSLAATLVLAVAGVFLFGVNHEAVAAQLALDHMKCFDVFGEEGTHDSAAAESAWRARRGWDIGVPASSAAHGLELVGVRRCLSTDGSAAHCMYRWRNQPLSVYIVPHELDGAAAVERAVEKFGHRAIMWTAPGRTYVIVTRGRPEGMDQLAAYIRQRVR